MVGIGLTAAVDLRRLQTPGGTALRWAESAVFGVCDDYLSYSVPDPSVADVRSREQLCADLRAATQEARNNTMKVGLALRRVVRHDGRADVQLVLNREGGSTTVAVQLARLHGHWRVVRNTVTCGSIGCP